jgi:hypothetical protein
MQLIPVFGVACEGRDGASTSSCMGEDDRVRRGIVGSSHILNSGEKGDLQALAGPQCRICPMGNTSCADPEHRNE